MQKIPRFRFSIRFMLASVMLLAILLASRNTLICNYHEWALEHATTGSDHWYVSSYESHIKELARLGRYQKRRFVLKTLDVESQEARRLFTQLRSLRVANAWLTMGPYGGDDQTQGTDNITVICLPDKMYLYQSVIENADAAIANNRE